MRRRIRAPVMKAVKDVQKNVAKVAQINSDLKTVDTDIEKPVKEEEKPQASSSAHALQDVTTNEQLENMASSTARRNSTASTASSSSSSSSDHTDERRFPEFAPPAKREGNGVDEDDLDQDFDIHGFDHPSTYAAQPWVWIPKDDLGLSELLVRELREAGVDASDEGAIMDRKGNVEVERNPPDEDWEGGHDA